MSNDGQFHGKRLVSRESSTASDVIDLVNDADDSDGDVAAAAFAKSTKPHQKSMNNGRRFRGERQNNLLTSSESDDVIDLVNDGEDEATKRRQAPTQPSSSSAKRKRSSYESLLNEGP
jgi:hypothetical protein